MSSTLVPIELSSTPGIVDTSTGTAITINATQDVTLSSNLTVDGNTTLRGNLTFGDASTDTIDLAAELVSPLIPDTSNTYDLGAVAQSWRNAYIAGTADIATLQNTSATIGTLIVSTSATIPYNNVSSGLTAVNVQSALDELNVLTGGGNVGSQATFAAYEFTATAAQTTFDLASTYAISTPSSPLTVS